MAEEIQELHREVPLSIQPGLQFKFHVLLECSEWRITTLGHRSLQFITKTQEIVDGNGKAFQHPLMKNIWDMVLKCTGLGDGGMITVLVPFNETTGKFDWKSPNAMKNANLWVRVFDVGSECIAEAEAIKADINMVGKIYAYWKRVQTTVWSEHIALESCSLS